MHGNEVVYEHLGPKVDYILVSHSSTHMLFDIRASHSFISLLFASILGLEYDTSYPSLILKTSMGGVCDISAIC